MAQHDRYELVLDYEQRIRSELTTPWKQAKMNELRKAYENL